MTQIIANDIQYYSYVLNIYYIWNHKELEFNWLLKEIKFKKTKKSKRKEIVCDYLDKIP